jgi:EAL domain-containing protein (putative c-di-GMP-specific phosphodiesterase class I)
LEIEITEGTLMSHTEMTVARLHAIRSLGVTVAIDDCPASIRKFPRL